VGEWGKEWDCVARDVKTGGGGRWRYIENRILFDSKLKDLQQVKRSGQNVIGDQTYWLTKLHL
jgi:hypothetical protein